MAGPRMPEGGCRCGAARVAAEADPAGAVDRNGSCCARKGFILALTPAEKFRLLAGEDKLLERRFNRHAIARRFFRNCGAQPVSLGADPKGRNLAAINLRCVDGIDLAQFRAQKFDGRSLLPASRYHNDVINQ